MFSGYLIFGGRPGSGIFERFSYAITWIATNYFNIPWLLHLLDDFQGMNTMKEIAEEDARKFNKLLDDLGVLQNVKKRVQPTRTVKYLGMWICTLRGIVFMDKKRVQKDRNTITKYTTQGWTTKKEMKRLLGRLICISFIFRSERLSC